MYKDVCNEVSNQELSQISGGGDKQDFACKMALLSCGVDSVGALLGLETSDPSGSCEVAKSVCGG